LVPRRWPRRRRSRASRGRRARCVCRRRGDLSRPPLTEDRRSPASHATRRSSRTSCWNGGSQFRAGRGSEPTLLAARTGAARPGRRAHYPYAAPPRFPRLRACGGGACASCGDPAARPEATVGSCRLVTERPIRRCGYSVACWRRSSTRGCGGSPESTGPPAPARNPRHRGACSGGAPGGADRSGRCQCAEAAVTFGSDHRRPRGSGRNGHQDLPRERRR